MSLNPKFSIITVTYNAASVITPTLQSIAAQRYRNIEFLLIDGGSTDNTVEVARNSGVEIATLISERDKGLYDAMNKGIARATGDYLCFLNAGDSFHSPDVLQQMVDAIADKQELPDILYGETSEVDEERRFVRMRRLQAPEKLNWRSFRHGMLVCHQAFFAKRTIAPMYDLNYRLSADVDWCIRVMKVSKDIVNTHIIIVDYLQNGLSLQHHRASLIERFRIMAKHYGVIQTTLRHMWFVIRVVIKR
ncbi:MAG: glycosyltransferase [Bacteroidaceae bacterium]|nr:glycosyltransferase [Bacteroidaceae bacterium]